MLNIAYLAHDLADASVQRRAAMLRRGGAQVRLAGFKRRDTQDRLEQGELIELGQTQDGRLASRAAVLAATSARIGKLKPALDSADLILARNLEMLLLACRAQERLAPRARIVYECLDIHRLLLAKGARGIALRALESRLWRQTDAILTSSPAFIHEYFQPRGFQGEFLLTENKVLDTIGVSRATGANKQPGPPWRIGYFGMLRCRRSLEILASLAAATQGNVQIAIRGIASPAIFPDFLREVSGMPNVTYHGPYSGAQELASAYSEVHFAWAIDFYEAGQNSSWLLPNRLYESIYFGAIPMTLDSVETGRWLQRHNAGVQSREGEAQELVALLSALTPERYSELCRGLDAIGTGEIAFREADCGQLVARLAEFCAALPEQPGQRNSNPAFKAATLRS